MQAIRLQPLAESSEPVSKEMKQSNVLATVRVVARYLVGLVGRPVWRTKRNGKSDEAQSVIGRKHPTFVNTFTRCGVIVTLNASENNREKLKKSNN